MLHQTVEASWRESTRAAHSTSHDGLNTANVTITTECVVTAPFSIAVSTPWKRCRGVAQPGRAPGSGPGGRRFKSSLPDQYLQQLAILATLQIEPLVRLLWVPQSKCRSRRDLASVDNPRMGHPIGAPIR